MHIHNTPWEEDSNEEGFLDPQFTSDEESDSEAEWLCIMMGMILTMSNAFIPKTYVDSWVRAVRLSVLLMKSL